MRKAVRCLIASTAIAAQCYAFADAAHDAHQAVTQTAFKPFTGRITKNKVRLRLQPSLDGPILRELKHDDLIVVDNEVGDFYAVRPQKDIKGYVFRTFVLDNVVEGKHVNIRMSPDLEGAIVGTLNAGDRVDGVISPLSSKWLEITLPDAVKFYVSKEFVENIGDENTMAQIERRRAIAENLLEDTAQLIQTEQQKPYDQIQIEKIYDNLNTLIYSFVDFPEFGAKAKEYLTAVQESYLQKKIAYLEAKANAVEAKAVEPPTETNVEQTSAAEEGHSLADTSTPMEFMTKRMEAWVPVERAIYNSWKQHRTSGATLNDFYSDQKNSGLILTGVIEPYVRTVRRKPGDYLLVTKNSKTPIAYLYSTKVDLQSKLGQEVTLIAVPRPNNNFAYPAYFILSIE